MAVSRGNNLLAPPALKWARLRTPGPASGAEATVPRWDTQLEGKYPPRKTPTILALVKTVFINLDLLRVSLRIFTRICHGSDKLTGG